MKNLRILNKKTDIVPPDAVYIGRGSMWGNPFIIGVHGTRTEVIRMYEDYLGDMIKNGKITYEDLLELDDKPLLCYCSPKRCHGEVIRKYIMIARESAGYEAICWNRP